MLRNEDLEISVTPKVSIRPRPSVYSPERFRAMAQLGSSSPPENRRKNVSSGRRWNHSVRSSGSGSGDKDSENDRLSPRVRNVSGESPYGSEESRSSGLSGSAESSPKTPCSSASKLQYGTDYVKGSEENYAKVQRDSHSSASSGYFMGIVVLTIVSVGIMASWYFNNVGNVDNVDNVDQIQQLESSIEDLKIKFPSQDKRLWMDFLSGIKTIITDDPTEPSTFLVLHNSDKEKQTSECIVKGIGQGAAALLSQSRGEPVIMKGEILQNSSLIEDYGRFFDQWRGELEKKHVMILHDLQNIPPVVAQVFHQLCDRQHPLIKKAAFFLTLRVQENLQHKKSDEIADQTLRSLWEEKLGKDITEPLITRMTDRVLSVKPEDNLLC